MDYSGPGCAAVRGAEGRLHGTAPSMPREVERVNALLQLSRIVALYLLPSVTPGGPAVKVAGTFVLCLRLPSVCIISFFNPKMSKFRNFWGQ